MAVCHGDFHYSFTPHHADKTTMGAIACKGRIDGDRRAAFFHGEYLIRTRDTLTLHKTNDTARKFGVSANATLCMKVLYLNFVSRVRKGRYRMIIYAAIRDILINIKLIFESQCMPVAVEMSAVRMLRCSHHILPVAKIDVGIHHRIQRRLSSFVDQLGEFAPVFPTSDDVITFNVIRFHRGVLDIPRYRNAVLVVDTPVVVFRHFSVFEIWKEELLV